MGFRKERGTTIYVINHINRELRKKKKKLFAFFVDLKAAFDRLDREEMCYMMDKKRVEKQLRERIAEIYSETKNIVKIRGRKTETFWTEKGVRQNCLLSPTLFNLYISDLCEEMRKKREGGVVIGRSKVSTLIYADDIVLLAQGRKELAAIIERFARYVKRKTMKLSGEKSKVMVFERGEGRRKKTEWRLVGKKRGG